MPGESYVGAQTLDDVASTMFTALTVGYYEQPILAQLNAGNAFIQDRGGSLLRLTPAQEQDTSFVGIPLDSRVFDRYAYSINNPLKHLDPTGHDGRVTIWYDEWGPLTRKGAASIANSSSDIMDFLTWALALEIGYAFPTLPGYLIAMGELAIGLIVDVTPPETGDWGYTKVMYDTVSGKYVLLQYAFDRHGNILHFKHMESWDGANWYPITEEFNNPPEEGDVLSIGRTQPE